LYGLSIILNRQFGVTKTLVGFAHAEVVLMRNTRLSHRSLRSLHWLLASFLLAGWSAFARADSFYTTNLVTDDKKVNNAEVQDKHLVNAWGISYGSTGPFWVSANGMGLANLYSVDPTTNATTKLGMEVTIPGDGSVTGQVFNGTSAFSSDRFLFVSEDGTISGWRGALGTQAEVLQTGVSDNVYKGVALATINGNTYLYAANFKSGSIDVVKGTPGAPNLTGNFTDPNLPQGYAPFNIQLLGGKLYVTYALQGSGKDEQHGAGLGFVNVFDTQGNILSRLGTMGTLNAPWGLAIAPSSFRSFAGDLLVGNFGDGTVNAFDLTSNKFVGQLPGLDGKPLSIDGLWGLIPGNGGSGGSQDSIYFSAGPGDESHGLFGALSAVPEPSSIVLGLIAAAMVAAGLRSRNREAAVGSANPTGLRRVQGGWPF
jgi:uncharacterized protein (TIGR03118 family)